MSERELEETVARAIAQEIAKPSHSNLDEVPPKDAAMHACRILARVALTASRPLILEDAAKVAREAATDFLTDRNAYVIHGPSGVIRIIVAAIRSLSTKEKGDE